MEEIKVGDYLRTNDGEMGKLIRIEREDIDTSLKWYVFSDEKNERYINKPYIVKHSKNIIDLIECGDYVNGMEVLDIHKPQDKWEPIEVRVDSRCINFILADEIKTILTKEQFEQNCYKLD